MSRTLRNIVIGAGGIVLVAGATIVAVQMARKSGLIQRLTASAPGRTPTDAELQLMELIGAAGWDIPADAHVGTDRHGPFVVLLTEFGVTALRYATDETTFVVESCMGERLTAVDRIGMPYDDFVAYMERQQ